MGGGEENSQWDVVVVTGGDHNGVCVHRQRAVCGCGAASDQIGDQRPRVHPRQGGGDRVRSHRGVT